MSQTRSSPGKSLLSQRSVLERLLQGCLCCVLLRWDLSCLWKVCCCQQYQTADLLAAPTGCAKGRRLCLFSSASWYRQTGLTLHCGSSCVWLVNFWLSPTNFNLLFWNLQQRLTETGTKSFAWKHVQLQCHVWWRSAHSSKFSLALIRFWTF